MLRTAFYFIPSAMTGFIVSIFSFRNRVSPKEAFEGLEPGEGKLSRPVLRGLGRREAARPLDSNRKFHKVCTMKLSRFRGSLHEFQQKTYGVNPSLRQYFHEARPLLCAFGSRRVDSSSGPLVEKHVKRYDPAVPHDDEIPPGVSRHFTRASRYPWNHPCIAIFLRSAVT